MTDGLKDRHRAAIIATIAANDRVERAVLFGSRATGTHSVSSDVDIALIGDRLTMTDQARLAAALDEIPMAQEIDLVLYDSIQDETLRKHIRYQSVEWYAKPIHGEANRGTSGDACAWPIMSLRQAGVSLIDCEHRTPPATNDGYPYVGIPQIKNGRVDLDSARPIAEEHFRDWTRKANPQPFDIILSRRCNPGETGFVSPGLGEFAVGQNLVLLRSDGEKIIKPFLRWLSRGPEWWAQVEKYINAGAVFDSLTCAEIPEFRLPIPPLSDQHAIAHILGTLDDKIELNRRMNATLEAMARALFKSWFVDFDPVRAKMEGRDTGLPKDIADLFPDRLTDSGMGEIPKGWTVGTLGDIAAAPRRGIDPARVSIDTPLIGLEHMPRKSVALKDWGTSAGVSSSKFAFDNRDILFGKLRPYFHKVGIAPVSGVCSTDIVVLKARMPMWSAFVLACVSSSRFVSYASQTSTGTRMPRTSWDTMSRYELCRPSDAIAAAFHQVVSPMLDQIVSNVHESRTLDRLRDALLPKLVSGELRANIPISNGSREEHTPHQGWKDVDSCGAARQEET